jgi:hypothetical protein
VEVTTREFQCLTSWLLHRGEHRQRESHGFPHLRGGEDHQSSATEGRRTQLQSKWEDCSQNPSWEEIQKRQSDGERSQEHYYPTNRLHSSPLSSSCHSWSTHLENHKAEHCIPNRKGKSKEVTPPIAKKAIKPLCADQVTTPHFSSNSEFPLIKSYDGRGDPANHIHNFQTHPSLCNLLSEVAC